MTDENGQPVNSQTDKRHTMFAQDVKRHINEANARQAGNPVRSSQPNRDSRLASMPSVGKSNGAAPDLNELMIRQA